MVQDSDVDKTEAEAHARCVAVAEVIERELRGRTRRWLAAEADYDVSQLSRFLNGHHVPMTCDQLSRLETALELSRGFLFRVAGYVDQAELVEDMILSDERIPDAAVRSHLSAMYRAAVESSSAMRPKPSTLKRARS